MKPFPVDFRRALHDTEAWGLPELAAWNYRLGEFFGEAAADFLRRHDEGGATRLVASHGQTVFHHAGNPEQGTVQIGEGAMIAAATGLPVVSDFRWADLAVGGQGAPVSAHVDWLLHRHAAPRLAIVNLGGITNITALEGDQPPWAWDSGPANAPLDAAVRRFTDGQETFDRDGARALAGTVHPDLLAALQAVPFFQRSLPRSTGVEAFGAPFVEQAVSLAPDISVEDLLATLADLAAWAIVESLRQADWSDGALYLCGGGCRNPALVAAVRQRAATLDQAEVRAYADLGGDADLREAVAFAVLADAYLAGRPAAGPSTTGAHRAAVLGKLSLPPSLTL